MQIEKFSLEDLKEVIEIERLSFKNPYTKQTFLSHYYLYPEGFLVAKKERVIGYIMFDFKKDAGTIVSLTVLPSYRNLGAGSRLLELALKHLSNKDLENVNLTVRRSNRIAQSLYKKFGFKRKGVIKSYYGDEDAIAMDLRLK